MKTIDISIRSRVLKDVLDLAGEEYRRGITPFIVPTAAPLCGPRSILSDRAEQFHVLPPRLRHIAIASASSPAYFSLESTYFSST
jgi:hypothetical protein